MALISIYDLNLEQLETLLLSLGLKKHNAKQIFNWIYQKNVTNFHEMFNISKVSQKILQNSFYFPQLKILKQQQDPHDDTFKILYELEDGQKIETVLMKFNYGFSVCISSQVGCNMGCKFCASGLLKKIRDLTTSEIILQVLETQRLLDLTLKAKITNLVVMGIGEPLDNFENVVRALEILKDHHGLALGSRHMTVSTCGLTNKIIPFAQRLPQVNLAISLHAPNDLIRTKLMPINQSFKIKELIKTTKAYISLTNRRVSFEYILIKDLNDSTNCAYELANLLKGMLCYVNIILYNDVNENEFARSCNLKEFVSILKQQQITCTTRLERGSNITGACGQLRSKHEGHN